MSAAAATLASLSDASLMVLLRTGPTGKARRLIKEELFRREREDDREYVHVNRMNAYLARNRKPGVEDGTRRSPRITRTPWRDRCFAVR